jgi:hypothetical protein
MLNAKTLLMAASVAVATLTAGAASAAPWEVRHDRQELRHDRQDLRQDRRELYRDTHFAHRPYVERVRIVDNLRFHNYRVIGNPYWVHDRYVVRTHDRFGRIVFVQVDPWSGAFVREVIL